MVYFAFLAVMTGLRVFGQNIAFRPASNLGLSQQPLREDDEIDIITGSQFNGSTTFANLPYTNCFIDDEVDEYDVAILGSPFDTVSVLLIEVYAIHLPICCKYSD